MTLHAGVDHLLLGHLREGDDAARGSEAFNMIVPGAVATFAARVLRSFLAGNNTLVVGILVEVVPHFGVATFAGYAAHEFVGAGRADQGLGFFLGVRKTGAQQQKA